MSTFVVIVWAVLGAAALGAVILLVKVALQQPAPPAFGRHPFRRMRDTLIAFPDRRKYRGSAIHQDTQPDTQPMGGEK